LSQLITKKLAADKEYKGGTPMNARITFCIFILLSLLLSACAAATQAPQAEEPAAEQAAPQQEIKTGEAEKVVEKPIAQEPQTVVIKPEPTAASLIEDKPAASVPGGNTFQNYGVNPFTDTYEDHLSTFALDVDTASYSVARDYIQEGNLPPASAVRVEEFINYFDQGYPTPPEIAFGIYADGAPSPFSGDETVLLRFGIQGYEVAEWERKPVVLTFVIDNSGSMGMENRLELVKRSIELLVERLRPDDTVSIVTYGNQAQIILYPTSGGDAGAILNAIYRMQPGGSTNAHAGLTLGYEMAMQAYRGDGVNRVILCSDGVANVGATDPEQILAEVRGYVEEGIYLTSIGVGMGNFNDAFMEQLADNGNGNYAYIDDLDEAQRLFVDDLVANLQVIALDAKVQVDFNPDVVAYYRLIGYENRDVADEDFRDESVDAGEIGAGHSVTALYAVVLKPGQEGRIATVQLRWQDPQTYKVTEINGNFNTWDLQASYYQADPHYQLAVLVAQFAEVLRHSPYRWQGDRWWDAETSLEQLYSMAYELPEMLSGDPDVREFVDLLRQASEIR
jgi:Ca-activated chloride channel family protein